MYIGKEIIISDPNYYGWFDKKFILGEKQIDALKSKNIAKSLRAGIDLNVIKAFNIPENFALLQ